MVQHASRSLDSWRDLFSAPKNRQACRLLAFYELRKAGEPFLMLPLDRQQAHTALALYPAQRPLAKFAKTFLGEMFQRGLPVPLKKVTGLVDSGDAFLRFLSELGGREAGNLPDLAIFAGNPEATGRRFIVLVFGRNGKPAAIVKSGLSLPARQLIAREEVFLAGAPPTARAIPRLMGTHHSPRLDAFAISYAEGKPPGTAEAGKVGPLLRSWLDMERTVPVREIAGWQRLREACGSDPIFAKLAGKLEALLVHPAIFHGDFAPWNIKVSPTDGSWTVLDWERGEMEGLPAWDWLHYVVQPAVLVARQSATEVAGAIVRLLDLPEFAGYAGAAGIAEVKRELTLAYLLQWLHVLKPAGKEQVAGSVLKILSEQWLRD
jgi:hypothetical protein